MAKKFFVSVQLPYSVIRGEQIVLQANVFNYNSEPVFVSIRFIVFDGKNFIEL